MNYVVVLHDAENYMWASLSLMVGRREEFKGATRWMLRRVLLALCCSNYFVCYFKHQFCKQNIMRNLQQICNLNIK